MFAVRKSKVSEVTLYNPCDGLRLTVTQNSKVPANQTACVGIDMRGYFVKLTNSEKCNNACEAYHHNSAKDTGISRPGRRRLDGSSVTHKLFVENDALKREDFNTTQTVQYYGHLDNPDLVVNVEGEN